MFKPIFGLALLALLALLFLAGCYRTNDEVEAPLPGCTFQFTNCFPVDPCENSSFSLHELLVIEGQGLYLETSVPQSVVQLLGFSGPGSGYALPASLLAGQYRPPGSPHFIVIPIPAGHPFWTAFNLAASGGTVLWSGKIAYPCLYGPKPVSSAVSH